MFSENFDYAIQTILSKKPNRTIYLVVDSNNRQFVVKTLNVEFESDRIIESAINESRIMLQLSHPNVLKCTQSCVSPKNVVIVTEFCPGGSLSNYLSEHPSLVFSNCIDIMRQIRDGYRHLFENSILHRDLKLENILVSQTNPIWIRIADFGSSIEADLASDDFVGTPLYMPYEIISGKASFSIKGDLWAIGICFWELIYGPRSHPFNTESMNDLKKDIFNRQNKPIIYPKNPPLRQEFYNFFSSVFQFLPELRMDAHEFFNHPIFSLTGEDLFGITPESLARLKNLSFLPTIKADKSPDCQTHTQISEKSKQDEYFRKANALDRLMVIDRLKVYRLNVELLYKTVKQWMEVRHKVTQTQPLSNVIALCIFLIDKGITKAELAVTSLNKNLNHIDLEGFEFLSSMETERKRYIEIFTELKSNMVSIQNELCLLLATESYSETFFQKIKMSVFHKHCSDIRTYYKETVQHLNHFLRNQNSDEDTEILRIIMKKSVALLKGKFLEHSYLFL